MEPMTFLQSRTKLKTNIATALFGALALVTMVLIAIPIIPSAAYLKYEPSGAVLLMAGVLLRPRAGLAACLVKDLLYLLAMGANPFGVLGDFLCTSIFAGTGAWMLRRAQGRTQAAGYLLVATILSMLVMIPANFPILYLEFGMSPQRVWASMPAIIPFNFIKGILNSALFLMCSGLLSRGQIDLCGMRRG